MATSAFKSTTKRTPLSSSSSAAAADDSSTSSSPSSSSTATKSNRRTRSLSRFSRRLPEPESEYNNLPKGKFVNTTRGSVIPDVSLDDLALELFSSSQQDTSNDEAKNKEKRGRGRSIGRWANDTASSSMRRGRSVSRQRNSNDSNSNNNIIINNNDKDNLKISGGKVAQANSRRRRSISVARNRISDSESDKDLSLSYGRQISSSVVRAAPNGRRLDRSLSLKDLSPLNDGYSSQSSALTDEETRNSHQHKFGTEKTIRTVYAQKKSEHRTGDDSSGLYEAMRKEVRHAVEEIRTEFEQAAGRTNATRKDDEEEIYGSLPVVKQKYGAKLKQSEMHKQDLLAEIVLEEQRGRDLSKLIVNDSKNAGPQRPARTRKRSNDRTRMSSKLVDEAEKYFEDFISSLEDTDISSFDGERSDGSSILGSSSKARGGPNYMEAEHFQGPAATIGTDGVILPWLQWETSNDASPSRKSIAQPPATPTALKWDVEEEMNFIQDPSCHSLSSRGSSTRNLINIHQITTKIDGVNVSGPSKRSQFDMDVYLQLQRKEDLLFEMFKERRRISRGGLLLCVGGL